MQAKVDDAKAEAGRDLEKIAPFAVESSARVMGIFLNRTFHRELRDEHDRGEVRRLALQREVAGARAAWEARWVRGGPGSLGDAERERARGKEVPAEFPSMEAMMREREGRSDGEESGSGSESGIEEEEKEDISEEE
jgi:hypothetical protein